MVERLPRIHEVMGPVSSNLALHEAGGVGPASLQIKHLGDESGGGGGGRGMVKSSKIILD